MLDIKMKHFEQKSKLKYVKLTTTKKGKVVKYLNPTVRIPRVWFGWLFFSVLIVYLCLVWVIFCLVGLVVFFFFTTHSSA